VLNAVQRLTCQCSRGTVALFDLRGGIMGSRAPWFAVMLAAALAMTPVEPASPNILELNFWLSGPRYDGALPSCDSTVALNIIASRFAEKEGRFWNSALTIQGYERIREIAYRPWAPNAMPRRFCSALALVSDGLKHPIYYSIAEGGGMIGAGFGVEWCVVGLDRNWAYSPACKMARP
jgi:hypothetical protein